MKHMILSLKMKGDVISVHFLTLWFQKDLGGGNRPKPFLKKHPKCYETYDIII